MDDLASKIFDLDNYDEFIKKIKIDIKKIDIIVL